jgi:phosphoglycolate phosphatase
MKMKKYETVIWDWNGTLLDDVTLSLSVVNELLSEHSLPSLTRARHREIFDFPVRLYYERAGLDLTLVDFEKINGDFCTRFEARLQLASLFPAVNRVLETVNQSGTRQFLLSSTEHTALNRMVKSLGLASSFDATKGLADGLARGKLIAGMELVDQFHIDPRNSVLIGDTVHDAEVADSLGLDCVLISSGHHSHERLSKLNHPVVSSREMLFQ